MLLCYCVDFTAVWLCGLDLVPAPSLLEGQVSHALLAQNSRHQVARSTFQLKLDGQFALNSSAES